jgi:hypothetical protein
VIARWPATLMTCEFANDVIAWMIVAPAHASATGQRRSGRFLPMTWSMRNCVLRGSTKPATRLISISTNPIASELRCRYMSTFASAHAFA